MNNKAILILFLLFGIVGYSSAGYAAACTSPAGPEGEIIYNTDFRVPQVCINGQWVAMGAINPAAGGAGCTAPVAPEGQVLYNQDIHVLQYCDGDDWIQATGSGGNSCTGPSSCTAIGDQCTDLTIFAGCHPTTYNKLFLHPNNQSAASAWSTESVGTGATDDEDGKVNQDWIVANKTITDYQAFKDCDDLNLASALGHTDWYLPSRVEIYYLWTNQTSINAGPGDAFIATSYWSSTERNNSGGRYHIFSNNDGRQVFTSKVTSFDVRCMRRD
jgi:hypothetical protein